MDNDKILETSLKLCEKLSFKGSYFVFVDFTRNAKHHRLFIINVKTREIEHQEWTSHGSGSGSINGLNLRFSNIPNSRMSSNGLLKTAETYRGKYGYSVRLDGLEEGRNDNVRKRAIVMHRSDYVDDTFIKNNGYPGKSWGCICMDPTTATKWFKKISNGSYVFVHTSEYPIYRLLD